jgi:iron-sulfur cluster repair protein YtfE (RIC family)
MDALLMLERDHRRVEQMLSELGDSEPGPERTALVEKLTKALELHMRFEEEHLYPLLQEFDAEMADEAGSEHQLARQGLATVQEMVDKPGFGAAVEMLTGGISHHVADEEGEAFPSLRERCHADRLASLGATLLEEQRIAGMLPPEEATKEELHAIAAQLGVEAKSSMSRDELREAIETDA